MGYKYALSAKKFLVETSGGKETDICFHELLWQEYDGHVVSSLPVLLAPRMFMI